MLDYRPEQGSKPIKFILKLLNNTYICDSDKDKSTSCCSDVAKLQWCKQAETFTQTFTLSPYNNSFLQNSFIVIYACYLTTKTKQSFRIIKKLFC